MSKVDDMNTSEPTPQTMAQAHAPMQPAYGNPGVNQIAPMALVMTRGMMPPGQQQHIQSWSAGLYGCCDDFGGCLFGTVCFWCLLCSLSGRMRESLCVGCFMGSTGLLAMRTKLRTAFGIHGTICNDCLITSCCAPCAACQLDRELKARGSDLF